MSKFIQEYFAQGIGNHLVGQLGRVEILQIIPNHANTVLNIFWNIEPKHLEQQGIRPGKEDYEERL